MEFQRSYTGTPWESEVGYCRALRAGNLVFVTGTAPVEPDGSVHAPGDAEAQTRRCLEIIDGALLEVGADRRDVVRTRMFVTDATRWREYGRAHKEFFEGHDPTTSLVEVRSLIDPAMLVEIEVDAVCG